MITKISGKVYVVGRDIDTDVIIPARHLNTMDPAYLAQHAMEDLDPKKYPVPFLNKEGKCDYQLIVAGPNFGCGSSRQHATIALAAAGIRAVIAPTFARIYYRNSVNGGDKIYPVESVDDLSGLIKTGEELEIDLSAKTVTRPASGQVVAASWAIRDLGPVAEIMEAGGLTAYNQRRIAEGKVKV